MSSLARFGFLGLLALSVGFGCTEMGRSVIPVRLSTDVTTVDKVRVVVVQGGAIVGEATQSWSGTPSPLQLGVFVSKDTSGPVDVIACGFSGAAGVAASGTPPASVSVVPGQATSPVTIALAAGTPSALCGGAGGPGGTGGGGAGTTGSAGAGGGSAGTTGTAGSGGGAAGTTGTGGGVAGTTGTAGTGGGGAGTTGTAGAGGRGGAGGGVAGTTGTAGAGGRGGAGGGVAGTTGTAGAGGRGGGSGVGGVGGVGGGKVLAWGGSKIVAGDPGLNETLPEVAVDANGNAVVIYQRDGQIWANRYDAATDTWGTPGVIDGRDSAAQEAHIGVDGTGTWLAVWAQDPNDTLHGIYQSTSPDGVHWTAPSAITSVTAWTPVLAVNSAGAAIVAWTEEVVQNMYQATASTRPTTTGAWSAPTVLRASDDTIQGSTKEPVVAISGTGEGFVLWTQRDPADTNGWISIWMRQHTPSGWMPAAVFETYSAQNAYDPAIAANKDGSAIATYIQVNSSTVQIWSRRYAPSTGFAAAVKVGEGTNIDTVVSPSITLDDAGVATAAWSLSVQGKYNVYASRLGANDANWPTATAIETDDAAAMDDPNTTVEHSTMPIVRNDAAGNVTLVWRKRVGTRFDLWARRFQGGAWAAPTLLETRDTTSVFWPGLGVGANGTAVAAWYHASEFDIWANVFH